MFSFSFCISLVFAPIESGVIGGHELLTANIPVDLKADYEARYLAYDIEMKKFMETVLNPQPYSVSDKLGALENDALYQIVTDMPLTFDEGEFELLFSYDKNPLAYGRYLNGRYIPQNEEEFVQAKKDIVDFDNVLTRFQEFEGYSYLIKDNPEGILRVGDLISEDSFTTSTVRLLDAYDKKLFEPVQRDMVVVLRKSKTGVPISGSLGKSRINKGDDSVSYVVARPKTVFKVMAQDSYVDPYNGQVVYIRIEEEVTPGGLHVMPQALQGVKDMNTGQQIQFSDFSRKDLLWYCQN